MTLGNTSNEFLIKRATVEAIANSIRGYLGETAHVFISSITPGVLKTDITKYYYEEFDVEVGENSNIERSEGLAGFYAAGYEKNNAGSVVPVLYETVKDTSYYYVDRYFYMGRDTVNGIEYDKWRKIEDATGFASGSDGYTWDSEKACYVYTDIVVTDGNIADTKLKPTDFPAKITDVYNAGVAAGISQSGDTQIQDLQAENTSLKEENRVLESQVTGLQTSVQTLNKEVAELNTENNRLDTQIQDLQAENASLENQNSSLTTRNNELEGNQQRLDKQIEDLTADNNTLQQEVSSLETNNAILEADNTKIRNNLANPNHGLIEVDYSYENLVISNLTAYTLDVEYAYEVSILNSDGRTVSYESYSNSVTLNPKDNAGEIFFTMLPESRLEITHIACGVTRIYM